MCEPDIALRLLDRYFAQTDEIATPNLLTQAYIELPYTVAVRGVRSRFARALQILEEHRGRLLFPVDYFKSNAAQALIASDNGMRGDSLKFASVALEFASKDHSGFRYHPTMGLVSEEHGEALRQLRAFCH